MYKISFNEHEMNLFNEIEREKTRKSLMSIYFYLLKYADADTLKTEIQFSKLHKMYIRYHDKLGLSTLKKRVLKLAEMGLILIQKTAKGFNSYSFVRFNTPNKRTKNRTSENPTQEPDIIELKDTKDLPKYKNYNYTIDLDSNSNIITFTESRNNFDYESYIQEEQKANEEIAIKTAYKMFKALKVKSDYVKATVLAKLTKYANNITLKHLESYVAKAIVNARQDSERNYRKHILSNSYKPAKILRFCNYEQRTYDYDILEKKLLGWC